MAASAGSQTALRRLHATKANSFYRDYIGLRVTSLESRVRSLGSRAMFGYMHKGK